MRALVRRYLPVVLLTIMYLFLMAALFGAINAQTCKESRYERETIRCDDGTTWKKDLYGSDTWRSNKGTTVKRDRYGGRFRIDGRDRERMR